MDAWLAFLSCDDPKIIHEILEKYPDIFRELYERICDLCRNTEEVMRMFSKELAELDKNTTMLMIEELQDMVDEQKEISRQQEEELRQQNIELQQQKEELQQQNKALRQQEEELRQKDAEIEALKNRLAEATARFSLSGGET